MELLLKWFRFALDESLDFLIAHLQFLIGFLSGLAVYWLYSAYAQKDIQLNGASKSRGNYSDIIPRSNNIAINPKPRLFGQPKRWAQRAIRSIVSMMRQNMSNLQPQADLPVSKQPVQTGNNSAIVAMPKSNDHPDKKGGGTQQWLVVHASVQGKSHIEQTPPVPCQDNHYFKYLSSGWGIAVVCDGAGSKDYSHFGSEFVAKRAGHHFEYLVAKEGWLEGSRLPDDADWHEHSKLIFLTVRNDLEDFAKEQGFSSALLGCTVIVLIYSPLGVLVTHIGDGRAAVITKNHDWMAVITPHKGEEANQTWFLTSVDWSTRSSVDKYVESHVIRDEPLGFAVMSDGCEFHSFEVNIFDPVENKYKDVNRPFPGFFNPLSKTLISMYEEGAPEDEIMEKWRGFLTAGNEKLANEPDDKTLIFGVKVSA